MIAAGVPVVPGSEGDVEDIETGLKEAERIGYPVIIKAALGGGGRHACGKYTGGISGSLCNCQKRV